jgi:hypothetical protein
MARPDIIKPGAVLVRDAVQVHHTARDGEIRSPRVAHMADFILSMLTETERTAFSSQGRPQGYSPPVPRFVRAADAFIARFDLQELLQNHRENNNEQDMSVQIGEEHIQDEEPSLDPGKDPPPPRLTTTLLDHSTHLLQKQIWRRGRIQQRAQNRKKKDQKMVCTIQLTITLLDHSTHLLQNQIVQLANGRSPLPFRLYDRPQVTATRRRSESQNRQTPHRTGEA